MDRESRDLARRDQRTPKKATSAVTPRKTPSKAAAIVACDENEKENEERGAGTRLRLNFSDPKQEEEQVSDGRSRFEHPVYKEISLKNGFLNRQDLSTLKRMCKLEEIDSSGKRDLLIKRLKQFYKAKLLKEAGLTDTSAYRGFDYLLVVDFEATCEEKNATDYPHEIIEFPAVLIDVLSCKAVETWRRYVRPAINPTLSEFCITLTGIAQETVDSSDTFPDVLQAFQDWLTSKRLGTQFTFALVTDGPFDVGRFLRLSCEQASLPVPTWASRWINVRKAFSNFYRTNQSNPARSPGLQVMLSKLDLDFQGNPHSGLDDANNIARVALRLIRDGAVLKVNERLDVKMTVEKENSRDRRLPFVTPVSRKEADDWLLKCRRELESPSAAATPLDDICHN